MLGNFIGFLKAKDYRNRSSPAYRNPVTRITDMRSPDSTGLTVPSRFSECFDNNAMSNMAEN